MRNTYKKTAFRADCKHSYRKGGYFYERQGKTGGLRAHDGCVSCGSVDESAVTAAFAPERPRRAAWWCTAFSIACRESAQENAGETVEFRLRILDFLR